MDCTTSNEFPWYDYYFSIRNFRLQYGSVYKILPDGW